MRYGWMLLGVFVLLRTSGCQQHLFTDYRPLDQAGMWSSNVEELKKLNTSDTEVAQLVKAKQAGLSDDGCGTLVNDAHQRQHPFVSAASTVNPAHAGYTETRILDIGQPEQLTVRSGQHMRLRHTGPPDP